MKNFQQITQKSDSNRYKEAKNKKLLMNWEVLGFLNLKKYSNKIANKKIFI